LSVKQVAPWKQKGNSRNGDRGGGDIHYRHAMGKSGKTLWQSWKREERYERRL